MHISNEYEIWTNVKWVSTSMKTLILIMGTYEKIIWQVISSVWTAWLPSENLCARVLFFLFFFLFVCVWGKYSKKEDFLWKIFLECSFARGTSLLLFGNWDPPEPLGTALLPLYSFPFLFTIFNKFCYVNLKNWIKSIPIKPFWDTKLFKNLPCSHCHWRVLIKILEHVPVLNASTGSKHDV